MDGEVRAGAAVVGDSVAEGAAGDPKPFTGDPDHYRHLAARPQQIETALAEGQGRLESNSSLSSTGPLGDTPLVVLASSQSIDHLPYWKEAQQIMAGLSSNSRLVVASSGHAVHFEQPALVVESVRQVVNAARTGEPLQS